ncbi:MAG: hypothetical protein L3K23_10485 [Thermoplasmata archaeon]|nr:hypothetical protein [Thermoplasmata archaeon]
MSDRHVGKAWTVRLMAGTTLFAIALLVGTSAAGTAFGGSHVAPSPPSKVPSVTTGSGPLAPKAAEAPHPSLGKVAAPASDRSAALHLGLTASTLQAFVRGQFPTTYDQLAGHLPPSFWAKEAASINANFSTSFGCLTCAEQFVSVGAVPAAAFCFIAGVESLGLACVGAIATLGVLAAIGFFLGSQGAQDSLAAAAAANLAKALATQAAELFTQQSDSIATLLSAMNTSVDAFEYEASAAALSQLPNGTFNVPLDLVQSGVASQLANVASADQQELLQGVATLVNNFDSYEGSTDSLGQTCVLGNAAETPGTAVLINVFAPDDGGTQVCPTAIGTLTYPFGTYQAGFTFVASATTGGGTTCNGPTVYLNDGTSFLTDSTSGAAFVTTFAPSAGGTWLNYSSGAVNYASYNFTGYTGAWRLCSPTVGTTVDVIATGGFPLDAAAASQAGGSSPGQFTWTSSGASNDEYSSGTVALLTTCFEVGTAGATTLFDIRNAGPAGSCSPEGQGPQDLMAASLYHLATVSGTIGGTYWSFLRGLGYTNVNQVPANCIVPTPNLALAANTPISVLATVNATQMLQLYEAWLARLGQSFNTSIPSANLGSFGFCGHKITLNLGTLNMPFGVYGWGWLFNPNSTTNASGSSQFFGNHLTWNQSGLIYLAPALSAVTVPLNSTWLLPENNPSSAWIVPFTRTLGSNGRINIEGNGPVACLSPAGFARFGCNTTGFLPTVTGWLAGNSTLVGGSLAPTHEDPAFGKGWAVYLTVCFQALPSSSSLAPVYVTVTSCNFNVSIVTPIVTDWGCGAVVSANCGPTGGILLAGNVCGTSTIPVYGQIVAAIAGFTGTGSLGCLAAEAIALVIVVVIVVVVLALVVRVLAPKRR